MNRCAMKLVQHFLSCLDGSVICLLLYLGQECRAASVTVQPVGILPGAVPHFLMKTLLCALVLLNDSGSGHVFVQFHFTEHVASLWK